MNDSDLMFYYKTLLEYEKRTCSADYFCQEKGINKKILFNLKLRLRYTTKKKNHPEEVLSIAKESINFRNSLTKFIEYKGEIPVHIRRSDVERMIARINMETRIDKLLKEQGEEMHFINVNQAQCNPEPSEKTFESHSKKEQNSLELIVNHGVKIIIPSSLDTIKLVKIIEFMKDL